MVSAAAGRSEICPCCPPQASSCPLESGTVNGNIVRCLPLPATAAGQGRGARDPSTCSKNAARLILLVRTWVRILLCAFERAACSWRSARYKISSSFPLLTPPGSGSRVREGGGRGHFPAGAISPSTSRPPSSIVPGLPEPCWHRLWLYLFAAIAFGN